MNFFEIVVVSSIVGLTIAFKDNIYRTVSSYICGNASCTENASCTPMEIKNVPSMLRNLGCSVPESQLQTQLKKVESERNSKIMVINHGTIANPFSSLFSTPQTLTIDDATKVINFFRSISPTTDVDIIINTTGGSLAAAEVIANTFRNHKGIVRVHIPYYAMSAGFVIGLSADEIHLAKDAFVGPVDPQMRIGPFTVSATLIKKVASRLDSSCLSDFVKIFKDDAVAAQQRVMNILNNESANNFLCDGGLNHDTPLFYKDIVNLCNVTDGMSDDMLELYELYNNNSS